MNRGDVIHLAQIATLFICMGMAYQQLKASAEQVNQHTHQLDRIEHYLSSRDPAYWKIVEGQ
jgi:hypothetical protein